MIWCSFPLSWLTLLILQIKKVTRQDDTDTSLQRINGFFPDIEIPEKCYEEVAAYYPSFEARSNVSIIFSQ